MCLWEEEGSGQKTLLRALCWCDVSFLRQAHYACIWLCEVEASPGTFLVHACRLRVEDRRASSGQIDLRHKVRGWTLRV